MRASYLNRKIVLSDPVEGRSISRHSLRLRSLGGRSPHRDDDAYLSFINRVFLNVTKHYLSKTINSLSKKQWQPWFIQGSPGKASNLGKGLLTWPGFYNGSLCKDFRDLKVKRGMKNSNHRTIVKERVSYQQELCIIFSYNFPVKNSIMYQRK